MQLKPVLWYALVRILILSRRVKKITRDLNWLFPQALISSRLIFLEMIMKYNTLSGSLMGL